jgi:hypothetical protein
MFDVADELEAPEAGQANESSTGRPARRTNLLLSRSSRELLTDPPSPSA